MTFMMYTRNALMWKILDVRKFIQGKLELRTISITRIFGISRTCFLKWNIFITIDINFRFGLPNPVKNDMTLLKHWKTWFLYWKNKYLQFIQVINLSKFKLPTALSVLWLHLYLTLLIRVFAKVLKFTFYRRRRVSIGRQR